MSTNISKIIYINLDKRIDRKNEIEQELSNFNLSGERFPAIMDQLDVVNHTFLF